MTQPTWRGLCERHLQRLIAAASETGGAFWPSALDTRTGRWPDPGYVPPRVYRLIGAPQGSTLYWDQPMLVAAQALSDWTGQPLYAEAADRYLEAFLARCVADTGMFRWGNHAYFDLVRQEVVEFHKGYHELRPFVPAWDLFWRQAPQKTAAYIRTMAARHIWDPASGGFNRHDVGHKGHAFIEAGGILCESLAWLQAKTGDRDLLNTALTIARYSFSRRHPETGLVPNEPDMGRWDSKVCTSEIGLWAQCLLRAARATGADAFLDMARHAMAAYLDHAFDPVSRRYYGQVAIADGTPVNPEQTGYWPRLYTDPWNTDQWPTHDYPMSAAEACLSLARLTDEARFRDAIPRWAAFAMETRPSRTGRPAYADSYGRVLHFLVRASRECDDSRYRADAVQLAQEAVDALWENDLFQGYPDRHLYEAVDGVGVLLIALIDLERGAEPRLHGFGF